MKAFLASTIKRDSTVEALHDFVPDLKNLKMAYVPTAAHAEQGFGVWESGGSWKTVQTLCDDITVVKLEDYRDESVVEELKKYDVVWFAGGCCGYLTYWMRKCRIEEYAQELFKDRVYIGISAGSCAVGSALTFMEIYKDGSFEPPAKYLPGLGILDKEFYPHYDPSDRDRIARGFTGQSIYLVPDGEQIVVDGDDIKLSEGVEVLGE